MPIIICVYCNYAGQGKTSEDQLEDVLEHEKTCSDFPDDMR